MPWTNFHSHSRFSDGVKEPEEHLLAAIELGMPAYGFADHSPLPHYSKWSIQPEEFEEYCQTIDTLKEKYTGRIEVYKGLEMDFIPGQIGIETDYIKAANLDFTVGSIHFTDFWNNGQPWEIDGAHQPFLKGLKEIFDNDIQTMVCRYYELTREMVLTSRPDVVGHMDKIKIQSEEGQLFDTDSQWYKDAIRETLELIAEEDVIVEVNTRGVYKKLTDLYPSPWILRQIKELGIRVMINSDSHHPRELINHFSETAELLKEIGFKEIYTLLNGEWQGFTFDRDGMRI